MEPNQPNPQPNQPNDVPPQNGDANSAANGQEPAAEMIRQQLNSIYQEPTQEQPQPAPVQPQTPGATYHPFHPNQESASQASTTDRYARRTLTPQSYGTFAVPASQQDQSLHTTPSLIPDVDPSTALDSTSTQPAAPPSPLPSTPIERIPSTASGESLRKKLPIDGASINALKVQLLNKVQAAKEEHASRLKPFLVATAVVVVFLTVSYNEIAVAQIRQYVSPGTSVSTPIILDPSEDIAVGKESRIIIPKINVDVPVVYDITSYDENEIQNGLERGVVHYGNTAEPGENGNNVIVGHSSNNFFNAGKYKFAFVLLDRLENGDTFILHHEGTRYIYRVTKKKVIEPTDFSLIQPTDKPTTTLITCTPPGTSWRRLVIQGEQISPSPNSAKQTRPITTSSENTTVPGNAPSFWQNLRDTIFN